MRENPHDITLNSPKESSTVGVTFEQPTAATVFRATADNGGMGLGSETQRETYGDDSLPVNGNRERSNSNPVFHGLDESLDSHDCNRRLRFYRT